MTYVSGGGKYRPASKAMQKLMREAKERAEKEAKIDMLRETSTPVA